MENIIQLDSIEKYCALHGLPMRHPLVAVVDMHDATLTPNHMRLNYGLYALFIKHGKGCVIHYGRQPYDYQEGTVVSFAPGHTVDVNIVDPEAGRQVEGLLFHPDLILGTPLADKMADYDFLQYAQTEALHMSAEEQEVLRDCMLKIRREIDHPADGHSRHLICVYIELFLEYCLRFYDRQFVTRSRMNNGVIRQFEQNLSEFFQQGTASKEGLPSVRYFAGKACLSPNYFGDLVKRETGKTAKEYIQMKLIDVSKQSLLATDSSVTQIADSLGFQYPQHFIRLFKSQVGCTPREFRQRVRA